MSNPVYGKQAQTSTRDGKRPALFWVLIVGIILFFGWAPFQAALFNGQMLDFEKPLYWALIIASILLILAIVTYYKKFKLEDQRDWMAVLVILLPLTYLFSLISAASYYLAMNMVIVQCIYAALFIISLYVLQDRLGNKIVQTLIMTLSYIIVGFGFINWFGQWVLAGRLVDWLSSVVYNGKYIDAIWVDSNGPRLTSIFQYANTYAAFLMAFLFVAVFSLIKSKKWYGQLVHSFMLVPVIISIFLTLSRTSLLLLPLVFIVLLMFIKPAKQVLWIVYCALSGLASVLVLSFVTNSGLQLQNKYDGALAAKGWGCLLAASIVVAVISWLIQSYVAPRFEKSLQSWSTRKLSNLWLPVGALIIGGLCIFLLVGTGLRSVLPNSIETRIENINFQQHSVLERITFYKDATKLLADYPILGAGGGGWATLYEKYQDYGYTSRQAHNFFMQYLVEVCILGFIIFMSFIIFIFYKYIRGFIKNTEEERESHFVYFILAFSILVHSTLDFNMSYVFMGMLVYLGLGGMAADMDSRPVKRLSMKPSGFRPVYSMVIGVLSIVVLFTGLRYVQSSNAAIEAKNISRTSTSFEQIQTAINKDLVIRPTHPDSILRMAALYQQVYKQTKNEDFYDAGQALLNAGLKAEPFNKSMLSSQITFDQLKGENEKAFTIVKNNLSNFNWDIDWYNMLITQSFALGNQAIHEKNEAKAQTYFKAGMDAYQRVVDGIAHLKTLPPTQLTGRPFNITPSIALNAGKIQFMSGKLAEAANILKGGLNDDLSDPMHRELARYYVVALQKQGQNDEAWYNKLIKADPKEKEQIAQLKAQ